VEEAVESVVEQVKEQETPIVQKVKETGIFYL
jgi:hypothetical protein